MLKQIKFYILLMLTISFTACTEDNEVTPIFDEDSNTRVTAIANDYKNILTSHENGWVAEYQPSEGEAIFAIHFKFNTDNTTVITSDYNNGEDDLPTTFRVDINQLPELIFENYSTFHKLFQVKNFALGAEYEFNLKEISNEKIILESKTDQGDNKTILTLLPAGTNGKDNVVFLQGLEKRLKNGYNTSDFFRTLVVTNSSNEQKYISDFDFTQNIRQASINGKDSEDNLSSFDLGIKITETGFDFVEPFVFNDVDFTSFIYNEGSNSFTSIVGDLTTTISSSIIPGIITDDFLLIKEGKRSTFGYDIDKYSNSPLLDNGFWDVVTAVNANLLSDNDKMIYWLWTFDPDNNKASLTFGGGRIDGSAGPWAANYNFNMTIGDDKIIKFNYVGTDGSNLANYWETRIQPLLDFWSAPNGFIYLETGNFENDNNEDTWRLAGRFINQDTPAKNFYGVWWSFTD